MRDDYIKYLEVIMAGLAAIPLILLYWLRPPKADGHRLYALFVDCIPDAIVMLLAFQVVYWLFYQRGLVEIGPSVAPTPVRATLPPDPQNGRMALIPAEINKAATDEQKDEGERDVLIVVDVQDDFISGSLRAHDAQSILQPLNAAIHIAESMGMLVVFTKDWHPPEHWSFKVNGGPWATHCIMNSEGAKLSTSLRIPASSVVLEFGVDPGTFGYSPLENPALDLIVRSPRVRTVYVTGIALEYCVQATCRAVLTRGKRTVAVENAIACAGDNTEDTEKVWRELTDQGVVRAKNHTVMARSLSE
jgi:nicotinamidase/pyrazinamidase